MFGSRIPITGVRFFVYTAPELDHGWLQGCDGYSDLVDSMHFRWMSEVSVAKQLRTHP